MQRLHWRAWLAVSVALLTLAACAPANQKPIATFTVTPAEGIVATTFGFDASTAEDPDGSIASYAWDFGDGGTATGETVTHAFTTVDTFDVSLTVTDDDGASATATKQVVVAASGSVSGFVVNRKGGTAVAGTTVSVNGTDLSATTDAGGFYSLDAPAGYVTLLFDQPGYAQSRVDGLAVTANDTTHYDTVQQATFDPFLPVAAPTLHVDLENGDSVAVDPAEDTFPVTVSGTVEQPDANGFVFVNAAIGQVGGSSGFLNASATSATATFDGDPLTLNLSATGFDGATALYVIAYDLNGNRAERIVYVEVNSTTAGGVNLGPVSGVGPQAVTFGDTGVFGTLGGDLGFRADALLEALRTNDRDTLTRLARRAHAAGDGLRTQGYLDEVITWVDVTFEYDPVSFDLPTAFEVYRKLATEADEHLIGRFSPAKDGAQVGPTSFLYRDASASITAGVETSYRVVAVTGDASGPPADDGSDVGTTVPLPAFHVNAVSPADGADLTSVAPDYEMTFDGRSDLIVFGVMVLDRVQAESNFVEWLSPTLQDDTGLTGVAVPHNFDGSASTPTLQPYHAYDWQPIALTVNADETAISVAADAFGVFGLGNDVSDGPVNTFLTGDGSF